MALKPCRECNKKIDIESNACPNCGAPKPFEKVKDKKITSQKSKVKNTSKKDSIMGKTYIFFLSTDFIKMVWRGEWPLVRTYWYLGILFALPFYAYLYYLEINFEKISETEAAFSLIFLLFYYAYLVWINVAIWRSATVYIIDKKKTQDSTFWGYTAKVLVVLAVARALLELIVGILK